jgi:hypothetical protein
MPALDEYHDAVKNALVKDGWTITHDPLTLFVGSERLHIDLGAERVIAADRGAEKIAVEIKTFSGTSKVAELEAAAGQYVIYRVALRRNEPARLLYLAVPEEILVNLFQNRELWKAFIQDESVRLVGYDPDKEEVVQWIP